MALATLSIDLVAQLGQLTSGMDKAVRVAERSASQIQARWDKLAGVASTLGVAFGGALSAAGVGAFIRTTVDGIDRLNDLADATGASVESLSALEDVALRTGTSVDTVGDAVVKLNKVLSDAKPDSDAARALQAIGLSAEELKALDPAQALQRVAVELARFGDDGNKARLVQELFGKSIREVAPLLKDLAENGRLNATVTSDQAREAESFNKQLFELQKNATDAGRSLVSSLLPALNQFFDAVDGRGVGGFRELSSAIAVPIQALSVFVANVQFALRGIGTELGGIAAQGAALARLDFAGFAAIGQAMRSDAKAAREEFDRLQARLLSIGTLLPEATYSNEGRNRPRPTISLPPPRQPAGGRVQAPREIAPVTDPALADALSAIQQTDAVKVEQITAALDRLFSLRASGLGSDASIDQAIQRLRDELSKLDPEQRAAAESAERLRAILAQTPTATMQGVLEDIERLNKALETGAIKSVEQWGEAVLVVTQRLPSQVKQAAEEVNEFFRQAGRNIQDAIGDSVLATIDGRAKDIFSIWKQLLKRMASEAIAARLGTSLLGSDFAKTGQIGGFLGQAIDWFKALPGRANGGPVTAGMPYIVGERGPELMVPRTSGTVVPNGALAAVGSSYTWAPTININGSADTRQIESVLARERVRASRAWGA